MPPNALKAPSKMLFPSADRGNESAAPSERQAIHEAVSYPRIQVTPVSDSCLNQSIPCEHVLSCGHIIITAKPDEPCAPNCYNIKNGWGDSRKAVSSKEFYCDACIETQNEVSVPEDATSSQAGTLHSYSKCFRAPTF